MMVAVALLAMAVASAAEQRGTLAIIAAGACAAIAVVGLLVFESTAHQDRVRHHEKPHLLSDSYVPAPLWSRRRRIPRRTAWTGR
ncbi:hypothetical protein [Nocardia alni]|uniref:hypothetical protein n=1 Tax=Nocardia alni TaxID=2815723 RepID=UPI001C22E184|nr:hypothetical protein [Nocardia alni]